MSVLKSPKKRRYSLYALDLLSETHAAVQIAGSTAKGTIHMASCGDGDLWI
jgi:hypothetical protein